MILILKIKIYPTEEQKVHLKATLLEASRVCNLISEIAWDKKIFDRFKLNDEVYKPMREQCSLNGECIQSCVAKVSHAYKLDMKVRRTFKPFAAQPYTNQQVTYNCRKKEGFLSIQTVKGRLVMPYSVCTNHEYFPLKKGESDLIYYKDQFFLHQTVTIQEPELNKVTGYIGVDLGITTLATLSNGVVFSGTELKEYTDKRRRICASIEKKGTRSSKKLLKRVQDKESIANSNYNHYVSKQIIEIALREHKGIALEDLTDIRNRSKRSDIQRWGFYQLRKFIEYKAERAGVPVVLVNPSYTSKLCSECGNLGLRVGKTFNCKKCNTIVDSDLNGSKNISKLGLIVSQSERPSGNFCNLLSYRNLKSAG